MMTEIEFTEARDYVGLGFKQVGDKVAVDATLAAQLIEQGFAKLIERKRTSKQLGGDVT